MVMSKLDAAFYAALNITADTKESADKAEQVFVQAIREGASPHDAVTRSFNVATGDLKVRANGNAEFARLYATRPARPTRTRGTTKKPGWI